MSYRIKTSDTVLVIEESTTNRYNIHNALRGIGFRSIKGVDDINQALKALEEDIGWIFLSFSSLDEPNLFSLLRMPLTYPEARNLRISVFVDELKYRYLSQAFEEGLLSYHLNNFDKNSLDEEIGKLSKILVKNNYDTCLISSEYLREYLLRYEKNKGLLELSEKLLGLYPGRADLLGHYSEALALNGQLNLAAATLKQTLLLEPSLFKWVNHIEETYFEKNFMSAQAKTIGNNILGIKSAVVVDPDEVGINAVIEACEKLGVKNVQGFTDPEIALESLANNKEPTVIIHEWKMPNINGPIFLQRIRQMGFYKSNIFIMSSLVKQSDAPLLGEMGVQDVLEKPLKDKQLIKSLVFAARQQKNITDERFFERKLLGYLSVSDFNSAHRTRRKFFAENKMNDYYQPYIDALFFYYLRDYAKAKVEIFTSIKRGNKSIKVYNFAGKILMKLRDFENALRCLEKANNLSPINIIRLCAIAESNSEMNSFDVAQKTIDKLKKLDPRNKKVVITEANFSLTKGDVDKAQKLIKQIENLDEILAYLNNRGVALAQQNKSDEALNFYSQAISAFPSNRKELLDPVHYNMGLSYIRMDNIDDALKEFKQVKKSNNKRISLKAQRMIKKVKKAEKNHETIKLDNVKEYEEKIESSDLQFISEEDFVCAGDVCCHLIYHDPDLKANDRVNINKIPGFGTRAVKILSAG